MIDDCLNDGLFNNCFRRTHLPPLQFGLTDTKLVSRPKTRSKTAKTTADELPTVADVSLFLLQKPSAVSCLEMQFEFKTEVTFKKKIVGRLMLCPLGQIKSFFPRRWPISSNARVVDFSVHQPTIIEWQYANSFVKSVLGQSPFTHLNFSLMKINQESTGLSGYRFWQIGKLMTDRIEFTLDI